MAPATSLTDPHCSYPAVAPLTACAHVYGHRALTATRRDALSRVSGLAVTREAPARGPLPTGARRLEHPGSVVAERRIRLSTFRWAHHNCAAAIFGDCLKTEFFSDPDSFSSLVIWCARCSQQRQHRPCHRRHDMKKSTPKKIPILPVGSCEISHSPWRPFHERR
jgi:hypothetical protein